MSDWLTVADLRVHLELPEGTPADGSDMETRMTTAVEAATETIDDQTGTAWADEDVLPAVVKQAGLLQAARLFKRQSATFGIAQVGTIDGGQGMRLLARLDPDVELLLAAYLANYSTL